MADPTTQNQLATIVNGILKDVIEGGGEAAAEAAAIAAYSWLGLPIIKQLFELVLSTIAGEIYKQAAFAATKVIIDVQVGIEESTVGSAFANLQMAVASGDGAAIAKASSDLNASYAALIHSDGSATP